MIRGESKTNYYRELSYMDEGCLLCDADPADYKSCWNCPTYTREVERHYSKYSMPSFEQISRYMCCVYTGLGVPEPNKCSECPLNKISEQLYTTCADFRDRYPSKHYEIVIEWYLKTCVFDY